MNRVSTVMIATLISWLIATVLYLILTLPLEWSEWGAFTNAANKMIAAAFGHGIYAVLILIVGLFVSFRRFGVRLAVCGACIALCVLFFGVPGGDNFFDWLRAFARWITAVSMPFIFYGIYSRRTSELVAR